MDSLLFLLDAETDTLCGGLAPVLKIVGVVYKGIQLVVPIILIIVGMMDFAKAVTEKSEDKIKEAQKKLIHKAVAAVAVFLIATIVGLLMKLVQGEEYKDCMTCVTGPFTTNCKSAVDAANSAATQR